MKPFSLKWEESPHNGPLVSCAENTIGHLVCWVSMRLTKRAGWKAGRTKK
jgi:hypothetical protein